MLIRIRKQLNSQRGFTLVELMAVIAILGVLAAIAVPKFTAATDAANLAKVKADIRTYGSAIEICRAATGTLPADLAALVPTYIAVAPTAPTGWTYSYSAGVASATNGTVTISSDGTGM